MVCIPNKDKTVDGLKNMNKLHVDKNDMKILISEDS